MDKKYLFSLLSILFLIIIIIFFIFSNDSKVVNIENSSINNINNKTLIPELNFYLNETKSTEIFVDFDQDFLLSWDSNFIGNCEASGDWQGYREVYGNELITNNKFNKTLILTCNTANNTIQNYFFIIVNNPVSRDQHDFSPNLDFYVNGENLQEIFVKKGEDITLSWQSENIENICFASGDWFGEKYSVGFQEFVNITRDLELILTCSGEDKDIQERFYIVVEK